MVFSSATASPVLVHQPIAPHQSAYQGHDKNDLQESSFKPVSEVASASRQHMSFREGQLETPLTKAVKTYAYAADVASSVVTYGPDGRTVGGAATQSSAGPGSVDGNLGEEPSATQKTSEEVEKVAQEREAQEKAQDEKERMLETKEQEEVRVLAARDREVRAHEQAHASVGGAYAGAPSYQFERGPDGVSYAVGGEVQIDTSKAATPEQTIDKAQTIRRAALAPAEPSPQDRKVAQESVQMEAEARQELAAQSARDAAVDREQNVGEEAAESQSPIPANDKAANLEEVYSVVEREVPERILVTA